MKILVTRPEIDQQQTIKALETLGLEGIASPVMEIVPLPFSLPDDIWQALVVTSRNGLRMVAGDQLERLKGLPLYCVGNRTADLARALGFAKIVVIAPNVAVLKRRLIAEMDPQKGGILYLAGKVRSGALDAALLAHGFSISLCEVYESRPLTGFSATVCEIIRSGQLDGILLYSQRSCRLFLSLVEKTGLSEHLHSAIFYCLSPAVALPLERLGYPLVVAEAPNERSLLACVQNGHN